MKKLQLLTLLFLWLISLGCVDSVRKGKPSITDLSKLPAETGGCGADFFLYSSGNQCVSACPADTHEGSNDEINAALNDLIANPIGQLISSTDFQEVVTNSAGVCFDNVVEIVRPDEQVFINSNFCSCLNGKADIINNCTSTCANRANTTFPQLFASVTLGPDIENNADLGNLDNWCNKEIGDGLTAPACFLQAFDGIGITSIPVQITLGSNSFTADISLLDPDKTYVVKLVESQSTSNASSNEFQIRRISASTIDPSPAGPLKIMPVNQYTCVTRSGRTDNQGDLFENAARLHFYYAANNSPQPLEPGDNFLFCHDPTPPQTVDDSPFYSRLELVPGHFSVWDQSDIRLANLDGTAGSDINTTIQNRLLEEYGVTSSVNLFNLFQWPNRPGAGETPPNVGFFMQPFVDVESGRTFCPTSEHYNSDDPLFKILKEVVGIDTEGIYLAERQPITFTDSEGNVQPAPQDILLVRENQLRKIWFHFENNQFTFPTDITAGQKTVMFFWPPDENDPHIKKPSQSIYTIRSASEIGAGGGPAAGIPTSITPRDKRFGCIPESSN